VQTKTKLLTVIIFSAMLLVGYTAMRPVSKASSSAPTGSAAGQPASSLPWDLSPRTNSGGGITISVQPLAPSADGKTWEFSVALNTHSVALDYDLTQDVILRDDRGEQFQPLAWDGSPAGGHHRNGILRFNAIQPAGTYLEMVIRGVAGVPERVFRWGAAPSATA
jgi:hypothetical protein